MADKYIDVSATYNGDGTTSAQAASDGAAGAWNDLLAMMIAGPVYGALNAGDNVWIRTEASGVSLSVTATAAKTMLARGSITQPVTWIFDNLGEKWSGDTGIFTININSTYSLLGASYNDIKATSVDGCILNFKHTASTVTLFTPAHQLFSRLKIQTETATTTSTASIAVSTSTISGTTIFSECSFVLSRIGSGSVVISMGSRCVAIFKNCTFDIASGNSTAILFSTTAESSSIKLIGGSVNGLQTQRLLNRLGVGPFDADGFDPGNLLLDQAGMSAASVQDGKHPITLSNIPGAGSKFDFHEERYSGYSRWKAAGNYLTLAATLPDAARTPWSIQCLPRYACAGMPHTITDMVKFYNGAADQLTLTLEFLLNPVYISPTSNGWWIEVVYTDSSTELTKFLSTYEITGTAISTSSVTWSSLVYGAKTYGRYKIAITTPTNVKADSDIRVIFRTSVAATNITTDPDFYFVCPDFSMVAA